MGGSIIGAMWRSLFLFLIATTSWLYLSTVQAQTNGNNPAPQPPPFPAQVKNTVVFLQTDCLHDFTPEIAQLTSEVLSKMPQQQVMMIRQQLTMRVVTLENI